MNYIRCGLLLLLLFPAALFAQPCAHPDLKVQAQQVKAVQLQLLAVKIQGEMDESVPIALQAKIRTFKDSLSAFADAAVACVPANIDPIMFSATLAKLLHANRPEVQEVYDPKKPPQLDRIYGNDLRVKVTASAGAPHLLFVEFNFGVDCGFDSVLLAYEQHGNSWHQALRWQSGDYNLVNGAFGDFFQYVALPQAGPNGWLLAVAHGSPWCSSRWSGFTLDLLQPSSSRSTPNVLQNLSLGYVRFEIEPVMKLVPDGFQLRLETGMIDEDVMTRVGIYRYRVVGKQLERVQPIADNGRDFVDEWLQSPWEDAARWSAPTGLAQLEEVHKKIAKLSDPNAKDSPLRNFGPVRGCSDAKVHFQVELDEDWVNNKGDSRPGNPTYFMIEQGKNSFTMLSAAPSADPHCTGPDIMARH